MRARRIMVQGTMSGVGKSLLCAALCRIFREDGLRVAPFKSQNMALNSYVTRDGKELGRAQALQAQAAGLEPDPRMNPVLLKPSSDVGSQVVVNGLVRGQMRAADYFRYKKELIPEILAAYHSLASENDVMVIEGAGSPAEINLRENDIVNMGLAELVNAPVLLVGDIDRGGVFAQLYGTVELLAPEERRRVCGLILNKFRGDISLLRPGLDQLEALTGIPVAGVVPWLSVDLEEEDSLAPRLVRRGREKLLGVAVLRLPRLSNFTDFAPLEAQPLLGVTYVDRPSQLGKPDLVILPGTKSATDDLLWLRETGLEKAVLDLAKCGTPILGICGGYQMLGERLEDPWALEGNRPVLKGLGLLPCVTRYEPEKVLTQVQGRTCGTGARIEGYEMHMGRTEVRGDPFCLLDTGEKEGCRRENVWGTYLHGLFDTGELTQALCTFLLERKGLSQERAEAFSWGEYRERELTKLAAGVRSALDLEAVYRRMEEYA